jgi:hypothetical protein
VPTLAASRWKLRGCDFDIIRPSVLSLLLANSADMAARMSSGQLIYRSIFSWILRLLVKWLAELAGAAL